MPTEKTSKESESTSKTNFVENEVKIIKCLMRAEDGMSASEVARKAGISRQLANHHLKNGLKGVAAQQNSKNWILQPAFYNLDTMATFLQPFILKAGEVYEGPEEEFEKYLALLLSMMTVEL